MKKIFLSILILLLLLFSFYGCAVKQIAGASEIPVAKPQPPVPKEEIFEIKIAAVGDVMVHAPQIKAQYVASEDKYDFTNNFQYIKPYIQDVDLALCNVETTFAGKNRKYSGYPIFNAPDELAPALKDAGFDVGIIANNHILDKGYDGLMRTVDILEAAGLLVSGHQRENGNRYATANINGVKTVVISYTYETTNAGGSRTLNGNPMSEDSKKALCSFEYSSLVGPEFYAANDILEDIKAAKGDNADLIILYLHWGIEYSQKPRAVDKELAVRLAEAGVDVIFTSHPHVLQPVEIITLESGKSVPIYYSMGNFISNQRADTVNNRKTEDGMIATCTFSVLKIDDEVQSIKLKEAGAIPTWVNKYTKNDKRVYEIIPIDADNLDGAIIKKLEKSLSDTKAILGGNFYDEELKKFNFY